MSDTLALDRSSVRTVDVDGHLHVALNPISKANICGYMGSEIPDGDKLGLQPDRIYQLYRDPNELRKGAQTFDGKPLLIIHKPQSADDHSRELTVGAIKNPKWDPPYLMAELDVWDGEAIAGIESGDRREISCGYRYRAVMQPGEADGLRFDGRMTDIVGNHVALVETGRAGSDVVVGDSAIQPRVETVVVTEQNIMTTTLSRSERVAQIKSALDSNVKGKMAADADITALMAMLDGLAQDEEKKEACDESEEDDEEEKKKKDKKEEAEDEKDDDDDEEEEKKKKEAKDKSAKDKKAMDVTGITKEAMDAALTAMAKTTESRIHEQFKAIREAEQNVRPWIGEIAVPQATATAVYRLALDTLKIPDTANLHPDALWPILRAQPKPGEEDRRRPVRMAVDSASVDTEYLKMFPNANRLMGG